MSNLIIPDVGKKKLIAPIGAFAIISGRVKLYANNVAFSHSTVVAGLTEAAFGGYANVLMTGAAVEAALDGSGRAVVAFDQVTFTNSSGADTLVYGYYVENGVPDLLWGETFDTPITIFAGGGFLKLTPKLTLASQFLNT